MSTPTRRLAVVRDDDPPATTSPAVDQAVVRVGRAAETRGYTHEVTFGDSSWRFERHSATTPGLLQAWALLVVLPGGEFAHLHIDHGNPADHGALVRALWGSSAAVRRVEPVPATRPDLVTFVGPLGGDQ